jgi:tyrosine-protein kinase Etk/Wzc
VSTIQASPQFMPRDDEVSVSDVLLTLRRHLRSILVITAIFGTVSLLYLLFTTPVFTITGTLYLGDARAAAPVSQNDGGLGFLSDFQAISDINTQIELISNKALVERAILESGLNTTVTSDDAPTLTFWRWAMLYSHSVDAFAPQPGDLQATDATFSTAPAKPVTFRVIIGRGGSYTVTYGGGWLSRPQIVLTGTLGQPASGDGLSLLLKPAIDGVLPAAGSHFSLKVTAAQALQESLQNNRILKVVAGGALTNPTRIANLTLLAGNPYTAQLFLNKLMNDFVTTQISWNDQAASSTEGFIADQLSSIRDSLTDADEKLAAYQAQTGIINVPENAQAVIQQLSSYETQRTGILLQQEALQQLAAEIAHPSGTLNPYIISQSQDPSLGQMAKSLSDAEESLQTLQVQFTGNAPEVQLQLASIAKMEDSIRTLVGNDLAQATHSLSDMDAQIAQYNQQLKTMPAESLQVISLNRASDVFGQIYVLLMQKQEEAEVSKAAASVNTRTVAPAEVLLKATKPKAMVTIGVGLLLGALAGAALALLQNAFTGCYQSEDEIRRRVPLPVYGVVPRRSDSNNKIRRLLAGPQTPFAESMRLLRSNLYRSASGQSVRVVLVTSAGSNDGKTTTSANLAKAFADSGKRTILVDADLYMGRLHEDLRADATYGLTEWFVSRLAPPFAVAPGERFYFLAAGLLPPNPNELVNDPYFGEMIDALTMHNEMLAGLEVKHGMVINGVVEDSLGYGYGAPEKLTLAQKLLRPLSIWIS